MKEFAKKKGGKCLSKKYTNLKTKLKWECKNKHIWEARPNNVINMNRWCTICSQGISERICRDIFKTIFKKKFPKIWPKWLINQKGNHMELDGYCKSLNLAFEYQGIQHFKENPFFHKKFNLKQRRKDDKQKRKLCKKNNIKLIIIPYKIKQEEQPKYIWEKCKQLGIKVPNNVPKITQCFQDLYAPDKLKEMQEIAKKRGGKCLSKKYINAKEKLKWQCNKCSHKWRATADQIKNKKSWCPKCAKVLPHTLKEMQEIAKKRGGKCLSKKYINAKEKLKWQCKKGHKWEAFGDNIINKNSWCPKCAIKRRANKQKDSIENMQEIAKKRGGKCLSKKYINTHLKLKWKCNKCGYEWKALPSNIKRG
ncbi:zinc-ribbon domain-containing protein, partial [Patescibacteria group bacterium]|nr:zinc-ribbon domain-containing protein [Patescibacteria group bacterium]